MAGRIGKSTELLLPAKGRNQMVKADPGLLGVANPNINLYKTLVVVYRVGGQTCLSITQEGTTAVIPAAPGAQDAEAVLPAPGQELLVLAARYGTEGTWIDATTQLQHLVRGQLLTGVKGYDLGDPAPGRARRCLSFIATAIGRISWR